MILVTNTKPNYILAPNYKMQHTLIIMIFNTPETMDQSFLFIHLSSF